MSDDTLHAIAARVGVQRGFRNAHGQHVDSPPYAIAAVLEALGYDVSSDGAREHTLASLTSAARRMLPATNVVAPDSPEPIDIDADAGDAGWHLALEDGSARDGRSTTEARRRDGGLKLDPLPAGYHRLTIEGAQTAEGWVLAAPPQGFLPDALASDGRGFGVTAQVYGLRSASNFGIGDLSDVGDLAEGAGTLRRRLPRPVAPARPVPDRPHEDLALLSVLAPVHRSDLHRSDRAAGFCLEHGGALDERARDRRPSSTGCACDAPCRACGLVGGQTRHSRALLAAFRQRRRPRVLALSRRTR